MPDFEYEQWYLDTTMMTRDFYDRYFMTVECHCGESDCKGYRSIRKDKLDEYKEKCIGGVFYG